MTDWEERFWQLYQDAIDEGLDEDQALERARDELHITRYGPDSYYGVSRGG